MTLNSSIRVHRAVASSIMMTAYGHQIESDEDEFTSLAREAAENLVGNGSAGAALVDAIPLREELTGRIIFSASTYTF